MAGTPLLGPVFIPCCPDPPVKKRKTRRSFVGVSAPKYAIRPDGPRVEPSVLVKPHTVPVAKDSLQPRKRRAVSGLRLLVLILKFCTALLESDNGRRLKAMQELGEVRRRESITAEVIACHKSETNLLIEATILAGP